MRFEDKHEWFNWSSVLLGPSCTSEKVLRVLLAQAQKCFTHYWYTVWVQNFVRLKFPFLLKHLYYKIFEGFNFCGFVMGVITAPFSDYSCAMVLVDQWTSDGEGKQHTEFLFSGQWLDESKRKSAILELVLPRDGACSCVGVASQKFHQDYFSQFGWWPRKPRNLNTLRNLYPYGRTIWTMSLLLFWNN